MPLSIQQATLDDHSEVVPPLPIPNRTVKHLSADDSGRTSVKVGHRQALTLKTPQVRLRGFVFVDFEYFYMQVVIHSVQFVIHSGKIISVSS